MSTNNAPIVVQLADVDPSKISLTIPKKGLVNKPETLVTYEGRPLVVQLGTEAAPIECQGPLERHTGSKYESVKTSDPTWALTSPDDKKMRTSKIQGKLRLENYNKAGSADEAAYKKLNAIIDRFAELFESGVVNPATGQKERLIDVHMPASVMRQMFTTPIVDPTDQYAPGIKFKVRFHVTGPDGKNLKVEDPVLPGTKLTLDTEFYSAADGSRPADPFSLIGNGASGIWLLQFNPLLIGKGTASITFGLIKAKVSPRAGFGGGGSFASSVGFLEAPAFASTAGFGTGAAAGAAAAGGADNNSARPQEPEAKRQRMEIETV